jgi:excisionase family DNA binding protein
MKIDKTTPTAHQYLTRREVCELLKVSLPTLDRLTRAGVIKGYRIGYMIRYKANEIEQSLTQMMTGL